MFASLISRYYFALGIILYELLVPLDKEEWMKCISDLRDGFVSHDNRVTLLEKSLINFLLAPDPNYRPKRIDTIVQTVNCVVNEGKSNIQGLIEYIYKPISARNEKKTSLSSFLP